MSARLLIECIKLVIYMSVALGVCLYFGWPQWAAFPAIVGALVFHSLTLGREPRR